MNSDKNSSEGADENVDENADENADEKADENADEKADENADENVDENADENADEITDADETVRSHMVHKWMVRRVYLLSFIYFVHREYNQFNSIISLKDPYMLSNNSIKVNSFRKITILDLSLAPNKHYYP